MLNKFCFFLSLSTGTRIIGVLNVLYGLMTLVVETATAFHPLSITNDEERAEHAVSVAYTEDSIFTMQFLFGIYLIIGTVKEKQSFLFASMMLHLAFVGYSIAFIAFALMAFERPHMHGSEWSLPNGEQIANEALKIPINMYFVFIIYGRHEELALKSPALMEPITREHIESDTEEINFA